MADERLSILHVFMRIGATSGQYNEHCLPMAGERRIGICTIFPPDVTPPDEIEVFAGDGTARGFWRVLDRALDGDWDVIHVHAAAAAAIVVPKMLRRRQSFRNTVYTIQNSYRNYRLRNRLLLFPIVAAFRHTVVCSTAARNSLPRPLRALARGRMSVIPNAVDLARVDRVVDASSQPGDDEPFRVVSVGRVIPIKDPVTLLKAFGSGTNGRPEELVYVGTGDLEDEVRRAAGDLGVTDRVTITGLVGRDDVYRNLARGSVFVSTSHGEGMPVAVLEAMATGRPVVLSDIEPHREIVRSETNIPLIPIGDVSAFAEAIDRFRAMTPQERRNAGAVCRTIVEERYSLPAMAAAYEKVYRGLTARETLRHGIGGTR